MTENENRTINSDDEYGETKKDPTLQDAAEASLVQFLQSPSCQTSLHPEWTGHRVKCCGGSRSFYCPECYKVLIPQQDWPLELEDLSLPFQVDLLLDDRRNSSTGVQAVTVLRAAEAAAKKKSTDQQQQQQQQQSSCINVYDHGRGEDIPNYYDTLSKGTTFLLFPGEGSIQLSSLLNSNTTTSTIDKLVVLDCKWSHSSMRLHPSLAQLPRVVLDSSTTTIPHQTYYWRWHTAGPGMLSTIEAIYYCAWEVYQHQQQATTKHQQLLLKQQSSLTTLLWLFGIQRNVIAQRYLHNKPVGINPHPPFSDQGKEFSRKLRQRPSNKHGKNSSNEGEAPDA